MKPQMTSEEIEDALIRGQIEPYDQWFYRDYVEKCVDELKLADLPMFKKLDKNTQIRMAYIMMDYRDELKKKLSGGQ